LRRSHYIEADLRFFGLPTVPPVSSNAHAFIDDLNRFAAQQPAALLGCLYVFEGSMLGARILLPVLRETYDLQGSSGCAYYAAGENYPPEHWKHFKHRLESVATQSDAHKSAIIHGAESGFSRVGAMLAALMPASET
jgi:heme oxygenase